MSTNKEPGKAPSPAPADLDQQGCATSFLTGERNEMDKLCGETQAPKPEEYTQPDEEKETGGEG
jgi:Zn-finger nucleic acid-binding protein